MKLNGNALIIGGVIVISALFLGFIVLAQRGKLTSLETDMVDMAVEKAGVDRAQFENDIKSTEVVKEVNDDIAYYSEVSNNDSQSTPSLFLQGERIQITDLPNLKLVVEDAVKKNGNKAVELVVFEDFQCPACASFFPIPFQLKAELKDKVKVIHKNLPLTDIHPKAMMYARAVVAAGKQGKWYEFARAAFEKESGQNYEALDKLDKSVFEVKAD